MYIYIYNCLLNNYINQHMLHIICNMCIYTYIYIYIYIYIYRERDIYTHMYTYIYIYIYNLGGFPRDPAPMGATASSEASRPRKGTNGVSTNAVVVIIIVSCYLVIITSMIMVMIRIMIITEGTNGVSTNGITANCVFCFTEGLVGHQSVNIYQFCLPLPLKCQKSLFLQRPH